MEIQEDDRIKHNPATGRYHIDGGMKGYFSYDTAKKALDNYEGRVQKGITDAIQLQKDIRRK